MNTRELTRHVKDQARSLGFTLVGVTTPEPPPHLDAYQRWLSFGSQGAMSYLARPDAVARRQDPRRILPECQSILVLGIPYDNPASRPRPERSGPQGRVAAYAWGDDYHEVLKSRLRALAEFIEAAAGQPVPNRWYTDTGPILERELAQRAGLGWIGKNSMLINPEQGSYYLLAEILLGIELEIDDPISTDHCGTCTRCIEACPTACILPDRTLDASRCISYLTIELKEEIPVELRGHMGDWVFGCDVCQVVCPWNERFAADRGDPDFRPRVDVPWVDLEPELSLSREAFNQKFRGNPVKRPKRRGYLRNVAVALGNAGQAGSLAALSDCLLNNEEEPLVRRHTAWAIGQIGGEDADAVLRGALEGEEDAGVREEIQSALAAAAQ
jgi:epoxyqueuosine reductase